MKWASQPQPVEPGLSTGHALEPQPPARTGASVPGSTLPELPEYLAVLTEASSRWWGKGGGNRHAVAAARTEHDAALATDILAAVREASGAWNAYLRTSSEPDKQRFLTQADWLVAHEVRFQSGASGWPTMAPGSRPRLSALVQGCCLAVLARAFDLTGDARFLQVARRAARTLETDILDGGVGAPIGEDGLFFEEVAIYPATHALAGCLQALLGAYDALAVSGDPRIAAVIERGQTTLHSLLEAFDTGYWTRRDLTRGQLASMPQHAAHVELLAALARRSGCAHCAAVARRWAGYQHHVTTRLRYALTSRSARLGRALGGRLRRLLFKQPPSREEPDLPLRVCVPITAFPVAGGTRAVLGGIARAMDGVWEMEYLTRHVGPHAEPLAIQAFGGRMATPWQFPNIWLYAIAGWRKLAGLLLRGPSYRLILPQDGVSTGAFAALAARMAGVRVVCVDHGNVTLLDNAPYRAERMSERAAGPWPSRFLSRLRFGWYWPSQRILARIATRSSDFFLAAGEDIAETYQRQLGVPAWRVARFPFMIDVERYAPLTAAERAARRERAGIARDAIVVAMVCRLAPEKGMHVALPGIEQALGALPADLRARVCVVIAGDGPLRAQVVTDVRQMGLDTCCTLRGDITADEVAALLALSDIFLYTSTRGAGCPVAVLEAMAAGCAVIAATRPAALARILADGRGMAIPAEDVEAVSAALVRLIGDAALRRQMGQRAREYIAAQHSATALQRSLLRATYWSPSAFMFVDEVSESSAGRSEEA
jgi:glycosyltransferase involved in cell wall biosynthesis